MKTRNIKIPYSLREFVRDEAIQRMARKLYESKEIKGPVRVYLPLAEKRFNVIAEDPNHEDRDKIDELCFNLKDSQFIDELFRLKVLSKPEKPYLEDFETAVTIEDPEFLDYLHHWLEDQALILNYGVFSLHTFTGEGYCHDNNYFFHTGKGLYRVFRAFLENPAHILTYGRIYQTFQGNEKAISSYGSETINQIVGEIREKLAMKGKLSKLFLPSNDSYFLRST
jgi:hypothetical protein